MPPVYDQGDLGSCTANAVGAAFEFDQWKQGMKTDTPSRLFIYYNERILEGTVDSDSGAEMRDSIKAVVQYGVCPETEWPYYVEKFADRPSAQCYTDALKNQGLVYSAVQQNVCTMQGVLATGYPFLIGVTVYESFESEQANATGDVPMPTAQEQVLGGHALLVVGYDNATRVFNFRNSWGTTWGNSGYGTLPYEYLTNQDLSSDFWVLQSVEEGE